MFAHRAAVRRQSAKQSSTNRSREGNRSRRLRVEPLEDRRLLSLTPTMLKDINLTSGAGSSPAGFTEVNGTTFFVADDGVNGRELWCSDGSPEGTRLLKDINSSGSSSPQSMIGFNGEVYFGATDQYGNQRLWRSDGTESGTEQVPGSSAWEPRPLVVLDGTLYFAARDGYGWGIWKTDGTDTGTSKIRNLSFYLFQVTVVGETMYFGASDGSSGWELWKSDGTAQGTTMVKDINAGTVSSEPDDLTNVGGTLYFAATTADGGRELWKSDGTADGTVCVRNIAEDLTALQSSYPSRLANVDGRLYFAATDGIHGKELWTSDGTVDGTTMVADINPGSQGSDSGQFLSFDGLVYFRAYTPADGYQLWRTDGTAEKTEMVVDLGFSAAPKALTVANGDLYFTAYDSTNGRELWTTDGTTTGTLRVSDIAAGTAGSFPGTDTDLKNVHGALWYPADDGVTGLEPWTLGVNLPPVNSLPPSLVVDEGAWAIEGISVSDADAGAGQLVVTLAVDHGTLTVNDAVVGGVTAAAIDGNASSTVTLAGTLSELNATFADPDGVVYVTTLDHNGADTLTVTTNDQGNVGWDGAKTDTDSLTVTVNLGNNPPVAVDDTATVDEDGGAVTILVNDNDSDVDGDSLTVASVGVPLHGRATSLYPYAVGISYVPNANYYGADEFTYTISDGKGGFATATVYVVVNPVNDAPVANPQAVTTDEDVAQAITLSGSDVDGDVIRYVLVSAPVHGSLSGAPPNLTYTPAADYHGPDSFAFTVTDGQATSDAATVSITVNPVNDAPAAVDDTATVDEDNGVMIQILANDWDVDGDTLTIESLGAAAHGQASPTTAYGWIYYRPDANYNGPDQFTYTIGDGQGGFATATVSIVVEPVSPLVVQIAATSVAENAGPAATTVTISRSLLDLAADLTVSLTSSDLTEASVLATALIPAGQASVTVNLNAVDDALLDGTQTVTVTASADGYVNGSATVNVTDYETLTVAIAPSSISENGVAATGTVTRSNTDLALPLVVYLANSDTSEAAVPETVTIPSGQATGSFLIAAVDDDLLDGTQTATITASAPGYDYAPARWAVGLDNDFGTGGYASVPLEQGYQGEYPEVVVQPDGKIIAASCIGSTDPSAWKVVRTLADGTLDPSFGTSGSVVTSFANATATRATGIALQPDGKILVIGTVIGGVQVYHDWVVARYLSDGSPDASFAGGSIRFEFPDANGKLFDVAVLPNGQILLAGGREVPGAGGQVAVARLHADGSLDSDFGSDGFAMLDYTTTTSEVACAMRVQPDGRIVLAGAVGTGSTAQFAVARLTALGAPDTTFDGDAWQTIDFGTDVAVAEAITLQEDGKIVVAGYVRVGNYDDWGIARLNEDGSVDTGFSDDGRDIQFSNAYAHDLFVQPDGKIVVAGSAFVSGYGWNLALVRYSPEGTLDASFDGDGRLVLPDWTNTVWEQIYAVDVLPDGKVIALAGYTEDMRLARFNTGQRQDTLAVTDYETLTVDVSPGLVTEGGAASVTVTRNNTDIAESLSVVLSSSDTSEAMTPSTATIPAGETSVTVSLNALIDGIADGTQTVTVTASAIGYLPGAAAVQVRDNDAPAAFDDSYTTAEDTPLVVASPGVLGNDTDTDGDSLSAIHVSGPSHGVLTLRADGGLTYTPDPNWAGADSFTYKTNDGTLDSNVATVSITVDPVNDSPVAGGDQASLDEDSFVFVPVLTNDSDVDGDALTIASVGSPEHGHALARPDQTILYLPDAHYNGPDSFSYTVSDGKGGSATATVSITVAPVNDAPGVVNDTYSVDEDATLTVAAPGVLANDGDLEGDPITVTLASEPAHGTVSLQADGSFVYSPAQDFNGQDSFTYRANDGQADSAVATVTITIHPVNDAPVAQDDSFSVAEDQVLTIPMQGVTSLWMKSDPGDWVGQGLTYSFDTSTGTFTAVRHSNHSVTLSYAGGSEWWSLNFAAPGDAPLVPGFYPGATRWPFQAATEPGLDVSGDGRGSGSLTGEFTVHQAQYAADGSVVSLAATFEQHTDGESPALRGTIRYNDTRQSLSGVSANDGDIDGDVLSAVLVSLPSHGSLTFDSNGTFTYTPDADWNGVDTFTYLVNDGQADSEPVTVSISVAAVNDAPVAAMAGPMSGVRGQPLTFTFEASDPEDGDSAQAFIQEIVWGDGTVTVVDPMTTSSLQATHVFAASGTAQITVTAVDAEGATGTASQTVTVEIAELQGTDLIVGGTNAADTITLRPADAWGTVRVTVNGASAGTFQPTGKIVVYAQDGNDTVELQSARISRRKVSLAVPAILFGQAGADTLDASGSSASNVLSGGEGRDSLTAGGRRDLLFGGLGADTLRAGSGSDLLVGDATDYDNDLVALLAMQSEWARTDDAATPFQDRIKHLMGTLPGGNNGDYLLNSSSIHDDWAVDQLYGQSGQDWFLARSSGWARDRVRDAKRGDVITQLLY